MRERERERECVCACSITIQSSFIKVVLLGNKDGSGHSAHLRNMIRLFFVFCISSHTGLQKIQKKYPATSCGIKHKKLYLKSVFKSTT